MFHVFKFFFFKLCVCLCSQSLSHVQLFVTAMNCSPPGSSVHGIFQASILEWIAISSSRGSSQPRDQTCVSCIDRWILYHWAITVNPSSFLLSYTMLSLVFKKAFSSIQVTQISCMIELKLMSRYQKVDFHVIFHKSYLDLVLNHDWKFQSPS